MHSDPARAERAERGEAMPSVVAVVSVVAIIAALAAFFVGGGDETDLQARDRTPTAQSGESDTATDGDTAADTDDAGSDAGATGNGDTRAGRGEKAAPEGAADRRKRRAAKSNPTAGTPDVYVEVYNNSGVGGLAASTAAQLQDGGWQVVGIDNWHGNIPASTVYHPDGMAAEARQLARTLAVSRVRGAVAPMRFDRLTVILTADAA